MMDILNEFNTQVINQPPLYQVNYSLNNYSGTCTYKELNPISKLQPNNIYILTNSNMGDVIEYMNKVSPLSPDDMNTIQLNIREHSLKCLLNHLQRHL